MFCLCSLGWINEPSEKLIAASIRGPFNSVGELFSRSALCEIFLGGSCTTLRFCFDFFLFGCFCFLLFCFPPALTYSVYCVFARVSGLTRPERSAFVHAFACFISVRVWVSVA